MFPLYSVDNHIKGYMSYTLLHFQFQPYPKSTFVYNPHLSTVSSVLSDRSPSSHACFMLADSAFRTTIFYREKTRSIASLQELEKEMTCSDLSLTLEWRDGSQQSVIIFGSKPVVKNAISSCTRLVFL